MRGQKQKRAAIFLCLTGALVICLTFLFGTAIPSNDQISIIKDTNFVLDPDPNEVYDHIMVKIRPYKTFRLALKMYMDDDTYLWIYYAPTSAEPFQEYEGGPIHIGLDAALIDKEVHLIDLDMNLDLESFVVSEVRSIQEVEILGNRFDLFYLIAYRELSDGSKSNIVIDNFDLPGQDIGDRGWKSTTMDQFSISFDSEARGYLKAKYTITDDPNNDQDDTTDQTQTIYPYGYGYGYPYAGSYYGNTTYGGYYGSGSYGGGYYGGGYYGGGVTMVEVTMVVDITVGVTMVEVTTVGDITVGVTMVDLEVYTAGCMVVWDYMGGSMASAITLVAPLAYGVAVY